MSALSEATDKEARRRAGLAIKRCRESRGMTQAALGEQIGVTQQQIGKYERGQSEVAGSRLIRMARILGYTCEEVMGAQAAGFAEPPSPPYLPREADVATADAIASLDAAFADLKASLRSRLAGIDR